MKYISNVVIIITLMLTLDSGAQTSIDDRFKRVEGVNLTKLVNLNLDESNLFQVISGLDQQSDHTFSYSKEQLEEIPVPRIRFVKTPLGAALNKLRNRYGMVYSVQDNIISVRSPLPADIRIKRVVTLLVRGRVLSSSGQPLSSATVSLGKSAISTLTDDLGRFLIKVNPGVYIIHISYIGYKPITASLNTDSLSGRELTFRMDPVERSLAEVSVSGVKKKSAIATRSLMQIQDIPQSIVVMGQKVIQQQGAFDLTTITRNISGLTYTGNYSGAGSYEFFNARGFDLTGAQNYRWNGQMIWNLGNLYADNVEQVEFLKGPTSILFGDVSPGGVLNFVSKKPLREFYGRVDLKVGQWGLVRPALDFSGPLNKSRTLRFRLNASYEQSNSFRRYVNEKRILFAPTLVWDITPNLSVTVEAVVRNSSSTDDSGLVSPDGTVSGLKRLSPSLYLGEPSRRYLFHDQSYFSTFSYNLGSSWRLRMVNFFGYTKNRPFGIWPSQPDSTGQSARQQYGYHQFLRNTSTSIDIMGSFFTGKVKHNIVAGIDFQSTHYRYTSQGNLTPFDTINIFHPVFGVTPNIPPPTKYLPILSILSRAGFYAQDQILFLDEKVHLLLGIRAGRTSQGNHFYQDELAGSGYEGSKDQIIRKNVITPRIGLVFKPQQYLSLYASYSKGYEINSPDLTALNSAQYLNPPPTYSSQIELGAKASLFEDRFGLTLALFQIDKHDPYGYTYGKDSTGAVDYNKYYIFYQGHHRSQGIELDADGKVSKSFSITAGAAYTHAYVISSPAYSRGNLLANVPRFSGNIWLNYDGIGKLKGLSLGSGLFYKGKFFSTLDNSASLIIPANYTLDVSAGYRWKRFGAQLNISNLTNRVSYLNPWAFVLYDVQPLRRAVLSLNYTFSKL